MKTIIITPGQKDMFQSGEDLPLFSGTPQPGKDPSFTPKDDPQQGKLFNCPICHDTGIMIVNVIKGDPAMYQDIPCFCEASK